MIKVGKRTIEQAEDGSYYSSDAVTMLFQDADSRKRIIFYCEPNGLYSIVHDGITRMAQVKNDEQGNMDDDTYQLKKRMVAIVRAFIKGGLVLWGHNLLRLFLGPDHPTLPKEKGIDVVDWYMDMFTRIGVAHLMRNDVILTGTFIEESKDDFVYAVSEVTARPIAPDEVK